MISDNGRVRLGHALAPLGSLAAERVWDLAQTRDGVVVRGHGRRRQGLSPRAQGRCALGARLRFERYAGSCRWSLLADGTVYAGTGPNGNVVNLSDPKHPASRPSPKVQYIWDLAADLQGNLYAATGPTGQLWKRSADGKWALRYDSKATHLLCLAIGPDGSVYAGGDGEGLIYRVLPDGKATILFDAPQAEVRALLWAGDGALYAGTAAEAGGGSSVAWLAVLDSGGRRAAVPGRARSRSRPRRAVPRATTTASRPARSGRKRAA